MAYANYSNNDVRDELRAGLIPTPHPLVLGFFREASRGHSFEYAERRHPDDNFAPNMPHMIFVGNGETRLAKVLKTVAWVVIDEDEKGEPVYVQWKLRNHQVYDTSWVRSVA